MTGVQTCALPIWWVQDVVIRSGKIFFSIKNFNQVDILDAYKYNIACFLPKNKSNLTQPIFLWIKEVPI